MKSLRPQRARKFAAKFCENGFNASKAVRDLGITSNPKSAWVIGHRLLSNVVTLKAVEEHLKKSKMSADEVLERLTEIARKEAKFSGSDVVKANELLGKGHKIFIDKVESTDTSERDGAESAILKAIDKRSAQFEITSETSAIQLYLAGKDDLDSPLSKIENFGRYSAVIREYVSKSEIQESLVEQ